MCEEEYRMSDNNVQLLSDKKVQFRLTDCLMRGKNVPADLKTLESKQWILLKFLSIPYGIITSHGQFQISGRGKSKVTVILILW